MLETLLAAVVVTFAFLCLFRLSRALTGKILAEHAAMRVARARAVGMNDFMCLKVARVASIPVSGRRLWPEGDEFDYDMERSRTRIYIASPNSAVAGGILEYSGWGRLQVEPGDGTDTEVHMSDDWFSMTGSASFDRNFELFMDDLGL
jgi:hypothetical protein